MNGGVWGERVVADELIQCKILNSTEKVYILCVCLIMVCLACSLVAGSHVIIAINNYSMPLYCRNNAASSILQHTFSTSQQHTMLVGRNVQFSAKRGPPVRQVEELFRVKTDSWSTLITILIAFESNKN